VHPAKYPWDKSRRCIHFAEKIFELINDSGRKAKIGAVLQLLTGIIGKGVVNLYPIVIDQSMANI